MIGFLNFFSWDYIRVRLPFRMVLGRFGMWMMKVGRALQERYANWNREFRMKFTLDAGPNWGNFHVSEMVIESHILSFSSRGCQLDRQSNLVKELFLVQGVAQIMLKPYLIEVMKAEVFTWDELRPAIERVILEELTR